MAPFNTLLISSVSSVSPLFVPAPSPPSPFDLALAAHRQCFSSATRLFSDLASVSFCAEVDTQRLFPLGCLSPTHVHYVRPVLPLTSSPMPVSMSVSASWLPQLMPSAHVLQPPHVPIPVPTDISSSTSSQCDADARATCGLMSELLAQSLPSLPSAASSAPSASVAAADASDRLISLRLWPVPGHVPRVVAATGGCGCGCSWCQAPNIHRICFTSAAVREFDAVANGAGVSCDLPPCTLVEGKCEV